MGKKEAKSNSYEPAKIEPENLSQKSNSASTISQSPLERFEKSMQIDYEKWHDGIGYDLEALQSASLTERKKLKIF